VKAAGFHPFLAESGA